MLAKILIGVAGVLVLFVAVAATRPSAYHVERKLEVAAPADLLFGVLNDLHQFAGVFVLFGSPLEKQDPNMQKTFEGPAAGVGQSYAWSGKEAGKGKMTIEESVPGQKVGIQLQFVKPMASTATCALTLARTPTGAFVTWCLSSWSFDSGSTPRANRSPSGCRSKFRPVPGRRAKRDSEIARGFSAWNESRSTE